MDDREILSLEEQAAIERSREAIFKYAAKSYDLLPIGKSTVERVSQFSARPRALHEKKPATLKIQLCEISVNLFDAEAQHYPKYAKDEAELRSWLQPVAARIAYEVGREALDSSQDFHCSKAERLNAISDALNKRVDHWVGKKQSEIISRAAGPKREEAAPTPIRAGSWLRPIPEPEGHTNQADDLAIPFELQTKSIGELLDEAVVSEDITHEEQAHRIGIKRTAYYEVKNGRGGKKARIKTKNYLRRVFSGG
jgi:hypothetical protein